MKKRRRKSLIKKSKKIFKKIVLIIFTSGVIAVLFELGYDHFNNKPKTWVKIDSLEEISHNNIRYPNEINLNSNKNFTEIYESSFIINLYIKNNSDNELTLSNFKFNLSQYQYDFPVITLKSYIENNVFKLDIQNLSNYEISNLKISLYDEDDILKKLFNYDMSISIPNIKGMETKTIMFFSLKDIIWKNINTWRLRPYVIVEDLNENILITKLPYFSLNKKQYKNYVEEQKRLLYSVRDKYLYDITPDIIIGNNEIVMNAINEFIPAHETLNLQLLVMSQETCVFDLQVLYWIDDKEYSEDILSFIIYNPNNQSSEYEYIDEYIKIE